MTGLTSRARRARVALGALVVGLTVSACSLGAGGPSRHGAFDDTLGSLGMTVPLRPGSFVAFGAGELRNRLAHPVTLLSAWPVWSEHVTVARVRVSPYGPANAGAMVDQHVPGAKRVEGFTALAARAHGPHEDEHLYGLTIEVTLDPGQQEGIVLGMDVTYRDGARQRTQRFPMLHTVCRWSGHPCADSYRGVALLTADPWALLERVEHGGMFPAATTSVPPLRG